MPCPNHRHIEEPQLTKSMAFCCRTAEFFMELILRRVFGTRPSYLEEHRIMHSAIFQSETQPLSRARLKMLVCDAILCDPSYFSGVDSSREPTIIPFR
jgi:hypothetical protein